jgi:hypothetical protein
MAIPPAALAGELGHGPLAWMFWRRSLTQSRSFATRTGQPPEDAGSMADRHVGSTAAQPWPGGVSGDRR